MRGARPEGIVHDGQRRARQVLFGNVKSEVEAAYRKELLEATLWRRLLHRLKVQREIRRRLEKIAPRDALYLHRSAGRTPNANTCALVQRPFGTSTIARQSKLT